MTFLKKKDKIERSTFILLGNSKQEFLSQANSFHLFLFSNNYVILRIPKQKLFFSGLNDIIVFLEHRDADNR